jgi:hypothetical protein
MNDTKYITENYRKSAVEDKLATKILAYLYLNLPIKESELIEKFAAENTRIKLAELFKASLIIKTGDEFLSISQLGKLVLLKTEIAQVILDYLLSKIKLEQSDKFFLMGSIIAQSAFEDNYINLVTSFIKTLQQTNLKTQSSNKDNNNLLKNSLYGFVVGLDDNLRKLGSENYPEFIFNTLKSHDIDFWSSKKDILSKNKKHFITVCHTSHIWATKSNNWLYFPENYSLKNLEPCVANLTTVRIKNLLVNNESDNDLKAFIVGIRHRVQTETLFNTFSKGLKDYGIDIKQLLWERKDNFQNKQFDSYKSRNLNVVSNFPTFSNLTFRSTPFAEDFFSEEYLNSLTVKELIDLSRSVDLLSQKIKKSIENRKIKTEK